MEAKIYWSDFPDMPTIQKWVIVKQIRTQRIEAVEKYLRPDVPISFTKRQEIADYIQTLRDIPQNFSNPDLVQFPPEVTYG